ncbi:hypothetical protein CIB48_g5932 [Xylaria polymorpha]|nr:hypothetical protein CIB48_g5932 [Xylaria polymorpha]
MPYNTTAIPPRKEVTGQAQLPLSRVKKIIAQDPDISICSNNAAFVITLATLERKPRRNIQYKDLANAVSHQDSLQFLEDIIPKTVPYKQIKAHAAATRANLSGGAGKAGGSSSSAAAAGAAEDSHPTPPRQPNGKKHKGGAREHERRRRRRGAKIVSEDDTLDPNEQLQDEMRQANRDEEEYSYAKDVYMAD